MRPIERVRARQQVAAKRAHEAWVHEQQLQIWIQSMEMSVQRWQNPGIRLVADVVDAPKPWWRFW